LRYGSISVALQFQAAQADALKLAQQIMQFDILVLLPPLQLQFGAQSVSDKTDPHMVAQLIGSAVKYRAHAQIRFQMAEGILHLQKIFVMRQHSGGRHLLRVGIGAQQITVITNRFCADRRGASAVTAKRPSATLSLSIQSCLGRIFWRSRRLASSL
jgi:hypothetical protein